MATETKSSGGMKFKSSGDGSSSSKVRIDSSFNKKKVVQKSSSKSELKTKTTSSSSKTVNKTVTKTREKKVFSLPGQKYEVPEEREPLRIFYESLSKQIPSSEMAEFWLMEHGMLSPERARKALEKKQRKLKQLRTGTPIKYPTTPPSSKPAISKKPLLAPKSGDAKAKKRILVDSDEEDDFVLSPKRRKGQKPELIDDWKKFAREFSQKELRCKNFKVRRAKEFKCKDCMVRRSRHRFLIDEASLISKT